MKLTPSQQSIKDNQDYEKIIMYFNADGKVIFGLKRLKQGCLYTTLSLRPLFNAGKLIITDEIVVITSKKQGEIFANVVKIKED